MTDRGGRVLSRRLITRRISTLVVVPLLVVAFLAGLAPALNINAGNNDRGSGAYEGSTELAYWTLYGTFIDTIPTPVPGAASNTVGTPTRLAASAQSYAINTPTAGDAAVSWNFTEGTGAPINTEIEITFSIADGVTGSTTTVKVYIETRGSAPGSPIVFPFYFDDGGGGGPGSSAVLAFIQVSQQCTGVGTCP